MPHQSPLVAIRSFIHPSYIRSVVKVPKQLHFDQLPVYTWLTNTNFVTAERQHLAKLWSRMVVERVDVKLLDVVGSLGA